MSPTLAASTTCSSRAVSSAATEKRFKEIFQVALELYTLDQIDETELAQRKKAAREQARAHQGLQTQAYGRHRKGPFLTCP